MKRMCMFGLVLALAVPAVGRADQARAAEGLPTLAMDAAPEAWNRQDPADSVYRAARDAMNRGEYARAADLFRRIWDRHPRSTYAPDAPYWEAFNRYRTGDTRDLERALETLAVQRERYANAATRQNGDAEALATRIRGMLARRGNEDAAAALVEVANELSVGVGVAVAEAMAAAQVGQVVAEEAMRAAAIGVEQAAVALGAISGSRRAQVPEHCKDQVETQSAALNALVHMNADRAMPILKQVMERRDECSPPLRRRAVFLIADKETPETVDLLLRAAREDPDVEVRRQAVFWLSEVDDPRAVAALEQFLMQSEDAEIREKAVFALGQHKSPRGRQILRRVVTDADMPLNVRRQAIFWLGEEGSPEDVAFLRSQLGRLGDEKLDERIVFAVAQAGGRDNADWLLSLAANAQMPLSTRKMAVFWAAEAGAGAEALGALYDRFDEREMKERILFALSESDQPAAIDRLIRIARTERDVELRKKAIFWLGNSNDPRAAEVLMEIIGGSPPGR